jgi:hypothetical protein
MNLSDEGVENGNLLLIEMMIFDLGVSRHRKQKI